VTAKQNHSLPAARRLEVSRNIIQSKACVIQAPDLLKLGNKRQLVGVT